MDAANNVWVVVNSANGAGGGKLAKLSNDGQFLGHFPPNYTFSDPYTYSDFSGLQLRIVTFRDGLWTTVYDSGFADAQWNEVTYGQDTPGTAGPGTRPERRDRGGARDDPLDGPIHASPAELTGLVPDGRYLQIEVHLFAGADGSSPGLSNLQVFWQRP